MDGDNSKSQVIDMQKYAGGYNDLTYNSESSLSSQAPYMLTNLRD